LFTRGKKSKGKEEGQAKEAELFQQIGKLQMELVSRVNQVDGRIASLNVLPD
jgi:hypothetical protein